MTLRHLPHRPSDPYALLPLSMRPQKQRFKAEHKPFLFFALLLVASPEGATCLLGMAKGCWCHLSTGVCVCRQHVQRHKRWHVHAAFTASAVLFLFLQASTLTASLSTEHACTANSGGECARACIRSRAPKLCFYSTERRAGRHGLRFVGFNQVVANRVFPWPC